MALRALLALAAAAVLLRHVLPERDCASLSTCDFQNGSGPVRGGPGGALGSCFGRDFGAPYRMTIRR